MTSALGRGNGFTAIVIQWSNIANLMATFECPVQTQQTQHVGRNCCRSHFIYLAPIDTVLVYVSSVGLVEDQLPLSWKGLSGWYPDV